MLYARVAALTLHEIAELAKGHTTWRHFVSVAAPYVQLMLKLTFRMRMILTLLFMTLSLMTPLSTPGVRAPVSANQPSSALVRPGEVSGNGPATAAAPRSDDPLDVPAGPTGESCDSLSPLPCSQR